MFRSKWIPVLALLASPCMAFASADQKLATHMTSEITTANRAFQQASSNQDGSGLRGSNIEFRQFFLGLSPHVTFGLSKVWDVQIAPEVWFIWEKVDHWSTNH